MLLRVQVVVSRMRTISSQAGDSPIRIVGLCTSLANAKDLGEWIGAGPHGLYNFPPGTARPSLRTLPKRSKPMLNAVCNGWQARRLRHGLLNAICQKCLLEAVSY